MKRIAHTPIVAYMIIMVAVVAVVASLVVGLLSRFASAINSLGMGYGISVDWESRVASMIVSAVAVSAAIVIIGLAYATVRGEEE